MLPQAVIGSEQGGVRPVLVIQNDIGNRHSPTVIVAAITSRIKHRHQPTHVHLDGRQCGLPNDSTIMLEQLRTLDKQRLLGYIGSIGKAKMKEVDKALEISVGTSKKPLPP
ncbi:MAG: type II toxin-antitoxin system PemK/MazF family toxin [Oscillospiraceae bacterium]|nr:type II toxin-antitoxin system PemK/MazF family toxin [Oscillospiraceae bacterium]